jgi:hypothetical protein
MKGVRKLEVYQCACNEEGEILRKNLISSTTYDKEGEALEQVNFAQEQEVSRSVQELNEEGRVVRITLFNEDGECYHEEELTYTKSGKPETKKVLYQDDAFELTLYRYTDDDKPLEEKTEDEEGALTRRISYEYDDRGRLVSEACYDEEDGVLEWKNNYQYDGESERVIREERLGEEEELQEIREYDYGEGEKLLIERTLWPDGELRRQRQFTYNEEGLEAEEEEIDYDARRHIRRILEYDDKGRVSREQVFQGEKLLQDVTNEYDDLDNIVKELQLVAVPGLGDYFAYTANLYEMEYWNDGVLE